MFDRAARVAVLVLTVGCCIGFTSSVLAQTLQTTPPPPPADSAELPQVPKGVEVLTRGPVHEAFATPTTAPVPTKPVRKQPPKPVEEMPPAEKPEGEVIWIGGYWAWDDDRNDYLWVSGTWRKPPPGKRWVAGYWRQEGEEHRWVPGFWSAADAQQNNSHAITYLPQPPAPPETAPPGTPPSADTFFVPGHWQWNGAGYAWVAGYWARVQPGYVWVAPHYQWTPGGYLFIAGYWDLAVAQRGVLYAPVYVDPIVVGPRFVYTPAYVVRDTIVLDSLFIRPVSAHYYFGDYYGAHYGRLGYESCIVYSQRHYDPLIVYARYEHRDVPSWNTVQINLNFDRHAGRAPVPPRTLVQQNVIVQQNITNVNVVNQTNNIKQTVVNNNQVVVPASQLAASKGTRTVALDASTRAQAMQQAQSAQQVAAERNKVERTTASGPITTPRTASLNVPPAQPVGRTTMATTNPGVTQPATGGNTRPMLPATGVSRPSGNALSGPPSVNPGAPGVAASANPGQARPVTANQFTPASQPGPQNPNSGTTRLGPPPQPNLPGPGAGAPFKANEPVGAAPGSRAGQPAQTFQPGNRPGLPDSPRPVGGARPAPKRPMNDRPASKTGGNLSGPGGPEKK